MKKEALNLVVIGAGYVGLTTGVCFAYLGHKVSIVEKDKDKLNQLKNLKVPFYEPHLDELMNLSSNKLYFTDALSEVISDADIIMIAVGTPCKENGQADNRFINEAAYEIGHSLKPSKNYIIVIKSTVPIGTHRRVAYIINRCLEERKIDDKNAVAFASNPEFLREGHAIKDMFFPDRVVIGVNKNEDADLLKILYKKILDQSFEKPSFLDQKKTNSLPKLIITDPASAELIKYAANAFLALKISFINEIAGFCELIGANVKDVAKGIGGDRRIGPDFLEAGIGWGGSCFPKDTAALIAMGNELNYPMRIVEVAREVNYDQRRFVVEKLQRALKGVRGKIIGILGLTFKPITDDVRESPSVDLIKLLLEREAHVRVHDPLALRNIPDNLLDMGIEIFDDPYKLSKGADAIVLVTSWAVYKDLDFKCIFDNMRQKIILDGRNFLEKENLINLGFTYIGIGI